LPRRRWPARWQQTIDQLIIMRFFHGPAAAASVVINALMRDIYPKEEFSRMMSFVMLVTTIAPLVAPMVGGAVLVWFSWHISSGSCRWRAAGLGDDPYIDKRCRSSAASRFHMRTTMANLPRCFAISAC
jgi:DHA1 family bicyclomycin/chloramphenicol resistance-like MFS transporter